MYFYLKNKYNALTYITLSTNCQSSDARFENPYLKLKLLTKNLECRKHRERNYIKQNAQILRICGLSSTATNLKCTK